MQAEEAWLLLMKDAPRGTKGKRSQRGKVLECDKKIKMHTHYTHTPYTHTACMQTGTDKTQTQPQLVPAAANW